MSAAGSVPTGTRLGRYEIVSLLGRGGMGEVYTARDATLGRAVALKILPADRTSDPARVARFVREARASSALNHPAIVSVHDAGAEGDVHFLAMELIDGQSLTEWIRRGRGTARICEVMAQVAEGLARAHAVGIVHRDLKPDNIMVSRDGYAKIVDFGVAKLTERIGEHTTHTGGTTPTSRIGTTAYMSPEQVEGRAIDHRSDVFSFGVVLYELLTRTNPFAAPQYADTLYRIAHLDPPMDAVPEPLRRIVARCLRKDPELRYHSLRDAALDLRELPSVRGTGGRRRMALLIAAVVAAASAGAFLWSRRDAVPPPAAPALVSGSAPAMVMARLTNSGRVVSAAISPDGNYLVHAVREGDQQALYVKQIATGTVTRIADANPVFYFNLRLSQDGNYVYYAAAPRSEPNVVDVYQMPLLGGEARRIARDTEFWYSVSPDGTSIVFVRFSAITREFSMTTAAVDGSGERIVLRRTFPQIVMLPVWSATGESITFFTGAADEKESLRMQRLDLADGSTSAVPMPDFPGVGSYAWLPDGSGALVTVHNREQPPQIWFVPRGDSAGRKVTSEISAYYSVTPTADAKSFVTVRDTTDANIFKVDLRDSRPSRLQPLTSGLGNFLGVGGVRWIGDREVVYTGVDGGQNTFFVMGTNGGPVRRPIRNMPVWSPAVSPDGTSIAFVSSHGGSRQVWVSDISGASPRQLTNGDRANSPSFTADGRSIVYLTSGTAQYAWRIDLDRPSAPVQLTNVPTSRAEVSPDGRMLLCRLRSTVPGTALWRTAILPLDGKGEPRYVDAPRFGGPPLMQWHPDGRGFVYLDFKDGIGNLWRQDVDGGEPRQLTFFEAGQIAAFDLSPDGTQAVLSRGEPTSDAVLIRDFR